MNRISKVDYYANLCIQVSLRSTCVRRKVGAIIVSNNRIIATGYNGAPSGLPNCIDSCDRCYRSANNIPSGVMLDHCYSIHAEQNALLSAIKTGEDLNGAEIYVNVHPCSTCMKLIIGAGIKTIYYIDDYENEFARHMAKEAGVELIKVDGSKFRTPVGTEVKTQNDLDDIDPLVAKIYKYTPGTVEFEENRRKVLEEINFFEKYNEMIYYTDYKMDKEIIDIDDIDYTQFRVGIENRNNLEYNGDKFKQLVVGAIVFDVHKNEMYVLKCKGERLKDKLTMVQGHMGLPKNVEDVLDLNYANEYNLLKELEEEIGLHKYEILDIETRYCIQSNDNKISSEHMGLISIVYINTEDLDRELKSGEPEKHDVVKLTYMDISNLDEMNNYDTWLRKVLIKLKEDIMQ